MRDIKVCFIIYKQLTWNVLKNVSGDYYFSFTTVAMECLGKDFNRLHPSLTFIVTTKRRNKDTYKITPMFSQEIPHETTCSLFETRTEFTCL